MGADAALANARRSLRRGPAADRNDCINDHGPHLQVAKSTSKRTPHTFAILGCGEEYIAHHPGHPSVDSAGEAAQHRQSPDALNLRRFRQAHSNHKVACAICAVENSMTSGFTKRSKSKYAILINS